MADVGGEFKLDGWGAANVKTIVQVCAVFAFLATAPGCKKAVAVNLGPKAEAAETDSDLDAGILEFATGDAPGGTTDADEADEKSADPDDAETINAAADAIADDDAGTDAVEEDTVAEDAGMDAADAGCGVAIGQNPQKILFLGNSYTYVNDLPGMTVSFAAAGGVAISQTSVTQGAATLGILLTDTSAKTVIAKGGWTYVVIQGQSVEPAYDVAAFLKNAQTLAAAANNVCAVAAFYQTWPRKVGDALYKETWSGGTQAKLAQILHDGYEKAAEQAGGVRVPVGDAWMKALKEHPEIELYQADGSHPVVAGTYLAACVFAGKLFAVDPKTVTWKPGELPATAAVALRTVCAEVLAGK